MKIKEFAHNNWGKMKGFCSVIATLCTLITAIASVVLAKQALTVSEIALKTSSYAIEPILDIDVDWNNDRVHIVHDTSDIFTIKYVSFGLVRTIAVMSDDTEKISVRRHIVGGANRTLISVETSPRSCRIGTCRRLSAG